MRHICALASLIRVDIASCFGSVNRQDTSSVLVLAILQGSIHSAFFFPLVLLVHGLLCLITPSPFPPQITISLIPPSILVLLHHVCTSDSSTIFHLATTYACKHILSSVVLRSLLPTPVLPVCACGERLGHPKNCLNAT